jgi:flagellar basal-body rod modification protein FlgD
MQINPTQSISGTNSGGDAGIVTAAGPKVLGQDDFLKLLAVQMQSQDPLSPMQDTQFISQMANFTSLEQMKNLSTSFDAFIRQQRSVDAGTYLGKTVTLFDAEKGTVTGTVSGVSFEEEGPRIIVGGTPYDPATITKIQAASTPAPAATSSNS